MNRKITLNINRVVGNIRDTSDIGLPQGSALSPILFRIYVMDIAQDLENRDDICIYKFADDGSIKVTSTSTYSCVETMKHVLTTIDQWTKKWRMVINCQPNKTEIVGFSTAEGDRTLIPVSFVLGDKNIKRVSHTKVLGLVIDENLDFTEHSNSVYKKLIKTWAMISTHANRHWGFKQITMVQIIKTLWLPSLLYAGHIWINRHNIKEINSMFYKIIKSTVGAVFNIRQSYAEVILGLPPISIVNEVNKIKHYLKIIMTQLPEDRLRDLINQQLQNNQQSEVCHSIRQVFKYLKWKFRNHPDCVAEEDKVIIQSGNLADFCTLSPQTCKYTKGNVTKYTEHLWKSSLNNELQLEGHNVTPDPKCCTLLVPSETSREEEVLAMSMLYPNNLLNNFLHTFSSDKFPSSMCSCGSESENPHHVLFRCINVDETLREETYRMLQETVGEEAQMENTIILLKACKINKHFIHKICEIMHQQINNLKTTVDLQ